MKEIEKSKEEEQKQQQKDKIIEQIAQANKPKEEKILISHVIKNVFPYGFVSYGGPFASISMFETRFVTKLTWISPNQFTELFALCQSLPGQTSVQILVAIGTMVTKSIYGGLAAVFVFTLPSAVIMFGFGIVQKYIVEYNVVIPDEVYLALKGFQSSAVAVVASSAFSLSKKYSSTWLHNVIIIVSAFMYYASQDIIMMLMMLGAGGATTLFFLDYAVQIATVTKKMVGYREDIQTEEQQREVLNQKLIIDGEGDLLNDIDYNKQIYKIQIINILRPIEECKDDINRKPFGLFSFILFLLILIGLAIFKEIFQSYIIEYIFKFYYIGSIVIGGGFQVVPLMQASFIEKDDLKAQNSFWNGYAIQQILPGPQFNLATYVGCQIDGFTGGLLGYLTIYAPSILMVWGLLPYWDKYRKNEKVQKILQGLGCVSVGCIFASAVILYKTSIMTEGEAKDHVTDTFTQTLLCAISFVMLHIYDLPAPFCIFVGGLLTNVRALVRVNYRNVSK